MGKSFGFLLLILLTIRINNIIEAGLYSHQDAVFILNTTDYIYDSPYVWVVEFYNSWCGHCIQYAPKWKKFALEMKKWKTNAIIAAIDCAETINIEICRNFKIDSYPTLKLFPKNSNIEFLGSNYTDDAENFDEIRSSIIQTLEMDNDMQRKLNPISEIKEGLKLISAEFDSFFLVKENVKSLLGKELMLDSFSSNTYLISRIITHYDIPKLLIIKKDLQERFILSSNSYFEFSSAIQKTMNNISMSKDAESSHIPVGFTKKGEKSIRDSNCVHDRDVLSGLRFSFYNEIPLRNKINGESLAALKKFVDQLRLHLLINTPVNRGLNNLHRWLTLRRNVFHYEWKSKVDLYMLEFLPSIKYVCCLGSGAQFRGYPCALWTIFHLLTVNSHKKYNKNDNINVLVAIRGYVKHFFGCSECAKHFVEMSINMKNESLSSSQMIWLWQAHNKVNKRLHGDPSFEDPLHPKFQFPSRELCTYCRLKNNHWNMNGVTKFLKQFYNVKYLYYGHQSKFYDSKNYVKSHKPALVFFDNFDLLLCGGFYMICLVFMTVIFICIYKRRLLFYYFPCLFE